MDVITPLLTQLHEWGVLLFFPDLGMGGELIM